MMLNWYKGCEVPHMLPWTIVDRSVVNVRNGIASGNNEAVVHAGDNLGFSFDEYFSVAPVCLLNS
ncbi:hypothetical protein A2U01_0054466, partial [Trifolium medium]|nr:hypothetical protein [Trifolium medium]